MVQYLSIEEKEAAAVLVAILVVLEVIVCVALIAAVLMQSGKGGVGSTFGGGEGSYFGKGNDLDSVLAKATILLGCAFAIITLALAKVNA